MSNQINYYTNNNDANNISTYDDSQVITQIVYNDKVIPIPTPLVSIERENLYYNQYWGNSDKIVLDGYTYGNGCSPFNKIVDNIHQFIGVEFNIFYKKLSSTKTYDYKYIHSFNKPLKEKLKFIEDESDDE